MDYTVQTNQSGLCQKLTKVVERHKAFPFQKPTPFLQKNIFDQLNVLVKSQHQPIMLDFGCGTGMSTQRLAAAFPRHLIVGMDKSAHRLQKNQLWKTCQESEIICHDQNIILVQANMIDLIPLIKQFEWQVDKQFHFYPNPWPKAEQFKRRLHGHPIFPMLLSLSPYIEIRSNWLLYLEEFLLAAKMVSPQWQGVIKTLKPMSRPISLFEKKYWQVKGSTYQLILDCR